MVKRAKIVQKKLQKLKKAEQHEGGSAAAASSGEGPAPPKRIQQKLTKKVKFLQRVAASKSKLAVKAGVGKKQRQRKPSTLADLSTLMAGLQSADRERGEEEGARKRQGQSVGSQRGRARVLEQETSRLHQVLHHPQFLADPLAAVKNHLSATLPAAPPAPRPKKAQQPGAKLPRSERKKRQKANRTAAAAAAEMDE